MSNNISYNDYIKLLRDEINGKITSLEEKIDMMHTKLDKLDGRYASKLTERIVYALCALVLVAGAQRVIEIVYALN